VKLYKETRKILEKINDKIPMIISSNTIREFLDVQIDVLGNYFDHIFSAPSDFNIVKKDEVFYKHVLKILDVESDQVVHVGDHYNFDYLAPKKLGIKSYHLEREGGKKGKEAVQNLEDFLRIIDV
jgi:putative hydrolase of the HAD superfamily